MNNAKQLLPSDQPVPTQNETSSDVIVFDFVPQLLRLQQNRRIMIQDNLVLGMQHPLQQYKVLTVTMVKLSADRYTEKLIPNTSNTQNGNCLFPLFSGSIAHPRPEMTDFHSSHTYLRPQYSQRSFVGKLTSEGTTACFPNHKHRPHRIKFNHKATTFRNTMLSFKLF